MSVLTAYQHIVKDEGQPAHLARLPRVRVAQVVMDMLAHGWSVEDMCRQHPHLAPAEAHAALAYYFDNQDAIDAESKAEWEDADRRNAAASRSPFYMRMKAELSLP